MRIIISPAKKMRQEPDSLPCTQLPQFLPEAEQLAGILRAMEPQALQALWRCNDTIASCNLARLAHMELRRNLTPALLAFDGIQYQYMAPGVLEDTQLAYLEQHLRILSGFYGLLRPFDGVAPYRLEMQAKLRVDGCRNLYEFWNVKLAQALAPGADWILDLASKEYSRAVLPHLPAGMPVICCVFGQWKNGRIVEKGTLCKMARGQMVRFLAEENITTPEGVKQFDQLGYRYCAAVSTERKLVFLKE